MPGTCTIHPDRPIYGVCASCGRSACEECLVQLAGQMYCKTCLEAKIKRPARKIHTLLRLVLSLAPGVGHLYMGLLNRGFQLLIATFVGGFFLTFFHEALAAFWTATLVAFSVFDAREAHLRFEQGAEVPDKVLVDVSGVQFNQKWIAYGLIGIGSLALFQTFMNHVLVMIIPQIVNAFRSSLLGLACIGAGLWLLRQVPKQPAPPPEGPTP